MIVMAVKTAPRTSQRLMTVVFEHAAALLGGSIRQIVNVKLWHKCSCIATPPSYRCAHFRVQVDGGQDKTWAIHKCSASEQAGIGLCGIQ